MEYKTCSVCNEYKDVSMFFKKRQAYEGFCKACKEKKRKERFDADPSLAQRALELRNKRFEARPELYEARKAYAKAYFKANQDKCQAATRAWNKKNPEKRLGMQQAWQQKNRDVVRYHANKRRTAKLKATPKWADSEWEEFFTRECYHLATLRQEMLGHSFHVDHIVPLQSKFVCGLHCAANLQVLGGSENSTKGNYTWPDMW